MKYLLLFTADLDVLENYTGTPFLPSDSDILLDSPDQDDIGNCDSHPMYVYHSTLSAVILLNHRCACQFFFAVEYFADAINGSQSYEEKS